MNQGQENMAVILAAGKGTRMKADLPKVLFPVGDQTMIEHVIGAVEQAGFTRSIAVIGFKHEQVREALGEDRIDFALQEEQLGTGHAVMQAAPQLEGETGVTVVLAGDVPLIRSETLSRLVEGHRQAAAAITILTAILPDATGYGRILRDEQGSVVAIREHKDCTPEQLEIKEINSAIYAFDTPFLLSCLPRLGQNNTQNEYYLTDAVSMAVEGGLKVEGVIVEDFQEVSGVNTTDQLAEMEEALRRRHS